MKFVRLLVFPLSLCGMVALTLLVLHLTHALTVKHLSCQINITTPCPDYIAEELQSLTGKSIFFTQFSDKGNKILQHAAFLSRVEITKALPDSVKFSFSSLPAIYLLKDAAHLTWQVDQAGYMTTAATGNALPAVELAAAYPLRPATGEKIPADEHQHIIQTLDSLKSLRQSAELQFIIPAEAELVLADQKKVVFDPNHAAEQLTKLSYMLEHFSFQSLKQPIAEVDLRFSQIILRTASASAMVKAQ